MDVIKPSIKRPEGLPKQLEHEVVAALYPIIKKYKKTYLSNDRIGGVMSSALRDCNQILYKNSRRNK